MISSNSIEALEYDSYKVSARKEGAPSRPPRRESPRFNKQRKCSVQNGAHRRGSKCWGL